MMRIFINALLALVVPVVLFAQINWLGHTIDGNFNGASCVYAIDLDNDNDVDVLGAAKNAGDITWWENDGFENFTEHTIADSFFLARSVYAKDLDNDDDVDILGAGGDFYNGQIAWWENMGGNPPIFGKHTIQGNFYGASCVYAIDLDNDNDVDILGAGRGPFNHGEITWWRNDGGNPPTFTRRNTWVFDGASCVYAIDLDNDFDVDILGTAYDADDIAWWENDGGNPPTFTKHTIDGNFNGASCVYAIDLDNDNDVDVLGVSAPHPGAIAWWENDGGNPPSFTKHTIPGNFSGASCVYAIDLDNDNDVDVLGAAEFADDIAWWENDGASPPHFTKHTIDGNFNGASSVYAIDLENDNDVDVLGAAFNANDICWWANGLNVLDVSTVSIDISESLPANTTLNPQATVTNLGTENASFDVTCMINPGAYTSTETVTVLAPDDTIQMTFPDTFTFVAGLYTVTVYTQLTSDDNVANDTLEKVIEASTIDVGPVSIDIPDTIPENTTLNPQATFANLGTDTESFLVTCEIEPGEYTRNRTVQDLAPGDTVQITFLSEFTFESGPYTVTVYSRHDDDENPANDTLEKIIETHDPGVVEWISGVPQSFSFCLRTNPVKGRALFNLSLPNAATITLRIYDVSGRLIDNLVSGKKLAGRHEIPWDSKAASGIYFYKFESPYRNEVGKLVFVR